jgi:uncharacterized iron-regulated protein
MTDDLVERVKQLCGEELTISEYDVARAAIQVALEEAAKMSEDYRKTIARDHDHCGTVIAAAIRAMIKENLDD